MPYEVFTLSFNPLKTNPDYYRKMLEKYNLIAEDVVYFEHDKGAVESARLVGIKTYHYNKDNKDLEALKVFLENNL